VYVYSAGFLWCVLFHLLVGGLKFALLGFVSSSIFMV